jgi:hypothetical protein
MKSEQQFAWHIALSIKCLIIIVVGILLRTGYSRGAKIYERTL